MIFSKLWTAIEATVLKVGIVGITIIGSFLIYEMYIDGHVTPAIVLQSDTLAVDRVAYCPGDIVAAHIVYDKLRSAPAAYRWQLVDNYVLALATQYADLPKGHHDIWLVIGSLPMWVSPGTDYYFCGAISYRVNPWCELTYHVQTVKFKVAAQNAAAK